MQRYFVTKDCIKDDYIRIIGQDHHHIKNVMRMRLGDLIYVCDNEICYIGKINAITDKEIILNICSIYDNNPELDINITIAMGLTKREKTEDVLRKIVELGASGFVTVNMERSVVKESVKFNYERLKTIVKEASEQSHRNRLLEIHATKTFKEFIEFSKQFDLCLYAYEEEGRKNVYAFKDYINEFTGKNILVLSGPEGGFSIKEVELLNKANFKVIGLGPRILRCETAPIYITSVIAHEIESKKYED